MYFYIHYSYSGFVAYFFLQKKSFLFGVDPYNPFNIFFDFSSRKNKKFFFNQFASIQGIRLYFSCDRVSM